MHTELNHTELNKADAVKSLLSLSVADGLPLEVLLGRLSRLKVLTEITGAQDYTCVLADVVGELESLLQTGSKEAGPEVLQDLRRRFAQLGRTS